MVGGDTVRMGYRSGFFHCIEPAMKMLNIPVTEVYLGSHEDRPVDMLFNLEDGKIYSQIIDRETSEQVWAFQRACTTKREVKLSKEKYTLFDSSDESIAVPIEFTVIDP